MPSADYDPDHEYAGGECHSAQCGGEQRQMQRPKGQPRVTERCTECGTPRLADRDRIERERLVPRTPESVGNGGVAAFFGKWPGEESEAELLEALREEIERDELHADLKSAHERIDELERSWARSATSALKLRVERDAARTELEAAHERIAELERELGEVSEALRKSEGYGVRLLAENRMLAARDEPPELLGELYNALAAVRRVASSQTDVEAAKPAQPVDVEALARHLFLTIDGDGSWDGMCDPCERYCHSHDCKDDWRGHARATLAFIGAQPAQPAPEDGIEAASSHAIGYDDEMPEQKLEPARGVDVPPGLCVAPAPNPEGYRAGLRAAAAHLRRSEYPDRNYEVADEIEALKPPGGEP